MFNKRATSKNEARNFTENSQNGKILDWLRAGFPITGNDAHQLFGSGTGFNSRICQIRQRLLLDGTGEEILSHRVFKKTFYVFYMKGLNYDLKRQNEIKAVHNLPKRNNNGK